MSRLVARSAPDAGRVVDRGGQRRERVRVTASPVGRQLRARRSDGDEDAHGVAVPSRITAGTVEEIALAAEQGLLPIFRAQPGFLSYRIVAAQGDACLSVSRWETHEQANAAARTAADWVAENLARRITLDQEYLGEVVLSSDPSAA